MFLERGWRDLIFHRVEEKRLKKNSQKQTHTHIHTKIIVPTCAWKVCQMLGESKQIYENKKQPSRCCISVLES